MKVDNCPIDGRRNAESRQSGIAFQDRKDLSRPYLVTEPRPDSGDDSIVSRAVFVVGTKEPEGIPEASEEPSITHHLNGTTIKSGASVSRLQLLIINRNNIKAM